MLAKISPDADRDVHHSGMVPDIAIIAQWLAVRLPDALTVCLAARRALLRGLRRADALGEVVDIFGHLGPARDVRKVCPWSVGRSDGRADGDGAGA